MTRHLLAISLLVLAASRGRADAQCDPYSQETPIPVPRALRLTSTCGNGRVDTYATSCVKRSSGGCGLRNSTTTSCVKTTETCDGRALDGQTCATIGYAKGKLRCAATCDDFVYDGCTVCRPGTSCQERRVRANDFEDLTLFAQGTNVRAYWSDTRALHMAAVTATGALDRTTTIAKLELTRLVPVQVGDSALIVTGPQDGPRLSIVSANGTLTQTPLPGRIGMMFLPVVPVEGRPLAVVITEMASGGPNVLVVDERGAPQPITPIYAQNAHRRLAIVPLSTGKHRLRWATFEDELTTMPGDALMVMFDGHPWLSIVRNGIAENPFPRGPRPVSGATAESRDVGLDGTVIMSFGGLEDIALGTKHAIQRVTNDGLTHVFGDIAYDANRIVVARTSTMEVQAVRVHAPGDYDYDKRPDENLAISVRALVP